MHNDHHNTISRTNGMKHARHAGHREHPGSGWTFWIQNSDTKCTETFRADLFRHTLETESRGRLRRALSLVT